jgi:hypothetical protein
MNAVALFKMRPEHLDSCLTRWTPGRMHLEPQQRILMQGHTTSNICTLPASFHDITCVLLCCALLCWHDHVLDQLGVAVDRQNDFRRVCDMISVQHVTAVLTEV